MFNVLGLQAPPDEDLFFVHVMDKIAEMEGKKAIEQNQALKESGTLVIPEGLNQKCMDLINRMLK